MDKTVRTTLWIWWSERPFKKRIFNKMSNKINRLVSNQLVIKKSLQSSNPKMQKTLRKVRRQQRSKQWQSLQKTPLWQHLVSMFLPSVKIKLRFWRRKLTIWKRMSCMLTFLFLQDCKTESGKQYSSLTSKESWQIRRLKSKQRIQASYLLRSESRRWTIRALSLQLLAK